MWSADRWRSVGRQDKELEKVWSNWSHNVSKCRLQRTLCKLSDSLIIIRTIKTIIICIWRCWCPLRSNITPNTPSPVCRPGAFCWAALHEIASTTNCISVHSRRVVLAICWGNRPPSNETLTTQLFRDQPAAAQGWILLKCLVLTPCFICQASLSLTLPSFGGGVWKTFWMKRWKDLIDI